MFDAPRLTLFASAMACFLITALPFNLSATISFFTNKPSESSWYSDQSSYAAIKRIDSMSAARIEMHQTTMWVSHLLQIEFWVGQFQNFHQLSIFFLLCLDDFTCDALLQ